MVLEPLCAAASVASPAINKASRAILRANDFQMGSVDPAHPLSVLVSMASIAMISLGLSRSRRCPAFAGKPFLAT